MSKLGAFFKRLFVPITYEKDITTTTTSSSSPPVLFETQTNQQVWPSSRSSSPAVPLHSKQIIINTHSCTTSPRTTTRQTILHIETSTINTNNNSTKSNYLTSEIPRSNLRRLSAPLFIHTSPDNPPLYPSTLVNENVEEALLSSLHRASISSPTTTPTIHSISSNQNLTANIPIRNSSANSLTPSEIRSGSFNMSNSPSSLSTNLMNNISTTSGTPPTQFVLGPQSSSSPRVSIQSNTSPSHNVMKDISPAGETVPTSSSDRKMSLPLRGRRPSMFDPIDPKELQQALYASAAAKAAVVTNPADEDISNRPFAQIKISYDRDSEHVFIESLAFENLQILDNFLNNSQSNSNSSSSNNTNGNNSDSIAFYCRFRLHPEKRGLFQTKIVRCPRSQTSYLFDPKQLNDFELTLDQLNNHSIEVLLYKLGTIKPAYKDIRIATVKYDFARLNEAEEISLKKPLEECDPSSLIQDPDLGDLLVSLSYLQSAAKLAVVVLEAKNLRPLSIENKPYPEACVKVTLFDRNGKKIKRKKTSVQRSSDCPTFNEELVFELRRDIAQEVMIELRIVHESLSYKEQLGSIIFGPAITNMTKGYICPENIYWSTILSGESLNAQWQILKTPIRIEESK